jgi:rhodanese-related sulfurtransferase
MRGQLRRGEAVVKMAPGRPLMAAIDNVLEDARRDLNRLQPQQAAEAMKKGALLVDTRPVEQRNRDGEVPGALVIDRNVLEWRLDPTCPAHIQASSSLEATIIIMCNEGFSSSLAASTLQRLGLRHATDMIGGFQAWAASGLPVRRPDPHG